MRKQTLKKERASKKQEERMKLGREVHMWSLMRNFSLIDFFALKGRNEEEEKMAALGGGRDGRQLFLCSL